VKTDKGLSLRTQLRRIAVVLCDPIVALCLALMVTLPLANAFATDLGSAYTNTGLAVFAATVVSFIASAISGDGSDQD
jgi:hypothetical protein